MNRNVSDPDLVREGGRKAKLVRDKHLTNLKVVVSTPEGRAYVWGLLERTSVFQSIWESSARIHYLAGQQDVGQDIWRDIVELDPTLFATMKQEANEEEERING